MLVSEYSIIASVIFYNISLIVVFLLSRRHNYIAKHTTSLLLFLTFLGVCRLVIPISFNNSYVIRSYTVLPAIEDTLARPIIGSLTLGTILIIIWAAGTVFMAVRDIRAELRFRNIAKNYIPVDRDNVKAIASQLNLDYDICVSPDVSFPYTTGILHPVIYLPDIELSDDEWKSVLNHEVHHIKSRDGVKKLIFLIIEALFWWNPLAHMSGSEINTLLELRCDAKCTNGMNEAQKGDYLATLLSVMKQAEKRKVPALASGVIGTRSEMKLRFESLQHEDEKKPRLIKTVLPCILLALFVISYCVILQPARFPTDEMLTDDLAEYNQYEYNGSSELEESFILYKDGEYFLYLGGTYTNQIPEESLSIEPFASLPIIEGE